VVDSVRDSGGYAEDSPWRCAVWEREEVYAARVSENAVAACRNGVLADIVGEIQVTQLLDV
jgi:hypothetical protein